MRNIFFLLLILGGIGCVHRHDKFEQEVQAETQPIDSSLILHCNNYGEEHFNTIVYGERTFSGFSNVMLNGMYKEYLPHAYYGRDDPSESKMIIQFYDIDRSTGVMHAKINICRIPVAIGTYSNNSIYKPLHVLDTSLVTFSYTMVKEDGCAPVAFYQNKDTIPSFTTIQITDIDTSRRVVCGNFRMRAELSDAQSSVPVPQVVRFERGAFCTKY